MVESGGDLEQILSLAYERHREFQRAVRAFGSLHIPKNETSSIVHVFSLVLDTCIIVWGEELFSGREETQVDFKREAASPQTKAFFAEMSTSVDISLSEAV